MNTPTGESTRHVVERRVVKALAVYSAVIVGILAMLNLLGSADPIHRAIITMALGLMILWVVVCGLANARFGEALQRSVRRIPIGWQLRFVLLATGLAMAEEAITTTMTNLAPAFGLSAESAHITASDNYLIVITFSSVVLFVPEFVGWMLILRKWAFSPIEVFLLYGLLGSLMEGSLSPSSLMAGFWFFVYGLMIYLPARSVPEDRRAVPPRWYHYPTAVVFPLACALPVVLVDSLAARALGVVLWH